ncbi:uncharacterized protein FIBRA_02729 [Fibroporia radiculosa]|uniref:Dynamitin n=1 Tax=Fibroporia radiculosa TaxID=599839 RepID=J4GN25_9APHY|nr:uncharacterized protein FIBRA_02729 [Fibroporia radiculosa]CCM00690.1 predicted protein [Fibroporia radiculosa]
MSANKYASLPDIDTAPDVYETDDIFPSANDNKGDSSDEEIGVTSRSQGRGRNGEPSGREELDVTNLSVEEASKKFRKAEKKHHRPRIQYVYPPSPTSDTSPSPAATPAMPLSQRLRRLQAELSSLETELEDPSNPLLQKEREDGRDLGELIRGMVDVKRRLEKISKVKEGRGKLVSVVLGEDTSVMDGTNDQEERAEAVAKAVAGNSLESATVGKPPDVKDIAEMDRRVGELEKVVGSSSTALDELSPLPPPLLPMLTRLNAQLTLLTQPRHVDSISRRLKLLLSDLDRVSNSSAHQHGSQRRQSAHPHPGPASPHSTSAASSGTAPTVPPAVHEQLAPILTRLAPILPHIPHILTRLRTLSALHTSAASFQGTLEGLEEEQRKTRAALEELERAVSNLEASMKENEDVVKRNVRELDERVEEVGRRIEDVVKRNVRELDERVEDVGTGIEDVAKKNIRELDGCVEEVGEVKVDEF